MPPLAPPTGEGPGTLAVRTMSGREPGRVIAFWNAIVFVFFCVLFDFCVVFDVAIVRC